MARPTDGADGEIGALEAEGRACPGTRDRLYCAPEAAGQGIASRLYDELEAAAREQGIRRLFTEASALARRCI